MAGKANIILTTREIESNGMGRREALPDEDGGF
jgi:hypothetical protein